MITSVTVLSQYDGILSGKYEEDDKLYYFQLAEGSSMYPVSEDDDGRTYDVWLVDDLRDNQPELEWWDVRGREPHGTVTEKALLEAENISY